MGCVLYTPRQWPLFKILSHVVVVFERIREIVVIYNNFFLLILMFLVPYVKSKN